MVLRQRDFKGLGSFHLWRHHNKFSRAWAFFGTLILHIYFYCYLSSESAQDTQNIDAVECMEQRAHLIKPARSAKKFHFTPRPGHPQARACHP
jgi:hypothetical protein